jgi:TfoX/Sxy family transcriptional regulator of competence genes
MQICGHRETGARFTLGTFMLLDDLTTAMSKLGAEAKRMFGGTCFMLNGNLVIGTHGKTGLIVRVGLAATARALALGAAQMVMGERVMKGWVLVESPSDVAPWVELALAFNRTLPPEAARRRSRIP